MAKNNKLPKLNPLFSKFERKAVERVKSEDRRPIFLQQIIKKGGGACSDGWGGIVNITWLVDAGSNITITGTGTAIDPYVINAGGWAGTWDVVGPASSVWDNIVLFNWATGKLIKDSTVALSTLATTSALTTHTSNTSNPHSVTKAQVGLSNVVNLDTSTTANITDSTNKRLVTDANLTVINNTSGTNTGDQNLSSYATIAYADSLVVGLLDDRGNYDASTNLFPASGGSGTAWAILKGDLWTISVAGTLGWVAVTTGDVIRAIVDTPWNTWSNWSITENNLWYVPENSANKSTTLSADQASNIKFPSVKSVYDWATWLFATIANLALKENAITATTNVDFWSGAKTFINFATTLRATVLTGLSLASTTVISATDTLLVALGSLQAQITLRATLASPVFTTLVTLPTTQLWEASIKLDAVLSANNTRSGITTTGVAGATIAIGDLCYLNSSGNWVLTDGILDGTDTAFKSMLGICVQAAVSTGATEMLLHWVIRSTLLPTLTIWAPVYMANTDWDVVVTKPSTTNYAIRIVWFARTATELLFHPSNDYIVNL